MSTLSISPAFETAVMARPRLTRTSTVRLTRRGRIVVLLAFLATAFAVMIAFGGWATATLDSGGFVRHAGVGEGAPYYARPRKILRCEGRRRTDVRLWLEANPEHFE